MLRLITLIFVLNKYYLISLITLFNDHLIFISFNFIYYIFKYNGKFYSLLRFHL